MFAATETNQAPKSPKSEILKSKRKFNVGFQELGARYESCEVQGDNVGFQGPGLCECMDRFHKSEGVLRPRGLTLAMRRGGKFLTSEIAPNRVWSSLHF